MLLAGLSGLVLLGAAGGNLLPNPAFDGTAEPWRASGGAAAYVSGDGRAAAGSLMVARVGEIRADFGREHPDARVLSAGMSGDLEAAVARGATHVRVGSAVLGPRPAFK